MLTIRPPRLMPPSENHSALSAAEQSFATTRWSEVLAAGHSSLPGAGAALEKLCRIYWYPLYAFVRRQSYRPHDAEDLVQGFFADLLENQALSIADPARGRFRSFLLVRLKHFLSDEKKRAQAQKRGGQQTLLSLDGASAEELYSLEPATEVTPEVSFDRRWAVTVLEQTVAELRAEYVAAGREDLFEGLKGFQPCEAADQSYADVATRMGLSESAVKSAIWRLRRRHGELLREAIAQTVVTPAEVDEEIRYLISMLSG
jgi:RNA polymerase sigma factor (sigma-70 family)